jgi:hypothetical protein
MKKAITMLSGRPLGLCDRAYATSRPSGMAVLLLTLLLSACAPVVQGTIGAATAIDQSRDRQRLTGLLGEHIRTVKQMQAQANPMGDYLWAYAHENGLIPDAEKDPERITAMYQAAADKGSADARLKLALRKFNQGALLQESKKSLERMRRVAFAEKLPTLPGIEAGLKRLEDNPQLERTPAVVDLAEVERREALWREALVELELAAKAQCYYLKPYIFAPTQQNCLSPRIAADDIWSSFRDGMAYPKDNTLRNQWFDMALTCEASPAYQRAAKACVPGTAGRVKD